MKAVQAASTTDRTLSHHQPNPDQLLISPPLPSRDREGNLALLSTVACGLDKVSAIDFSVLKNRVTQFKGGQIGNCLENWKGLTADKEIIQIVKFGLTINVQKDITNKAFDSKLSKENSENLEVELSTLLKKGVVELSCSAPGDYFSPVFVTPKWDGYSKTF